MKNWEKRALDLLERTLNPVPTEINELDWKSRLSDKSERIAQHLSAFSHHIMDQMPVDEIIDHALREKTKMYPEKAIREFVANALIHQDLSISGTGVMIEIYTDRIEITNQVFPLLI